MCSLSEPWGLPSKRPQINVGNLLNGNNLPLGAVGAGLVVIVLLLILYSTYFTIDQGERGVILHNGAIAGEAEPGLHFKMPIITTIEKISVQIQKGILCEDRRWRCPHAGLFARPATGDDRAVGELSRHGCVRRLCPIWLAGEHGGRGSSTPKTYEQLKNVFGQFDAADAIQKRASLNAEVYAAIRGAVRGPVVIDSVQIEDISFSQQYEAAVEARMQAIVKQQQAEADKQKRIIDADAAAYEVKAAADAKAHQIEVQGTAEAGAIKARGDALRDNPGLPTLIAAEKWNGVLPTTMVPGNALPFLNLTK